MVTYSFGSVKADLFCADLTANENFYCSRRREAMGMYKNGRFIMETEVDENGT